MPGCTVPAPTRPTACLCGRRYGGGVGRCVAAGGSLLGSRCVRERCGALCGCSGLPAPCPSAVTGGVCEPGWILQVPQSSELSTSRGSHAKQLPRYQQQELSVGVTGPGHQSHRCACQSCCNSACPLRGKPSSPHDSTSVTGGGRRRLPASCPHTGSRWLFLVKIGR